MTPQPIDGTLLAAFQRFADLSQYWHRKHTPDSLAVQELEERHRLERDIPELIKRLTAFADVSTSHLFDVAARVKADPPREDAGQGWRMLEAGETVQHDDECRHFSSHAWEPIQFEAGDKITDRDVGYYRRRIAKDTPKDTAGHIRADFDPNEALDGKESQETASKESWRMLKSGEEIRKGDQYRDDKDPSKWEDVSCAIGCMAPPLEGFFRRKESYRMLAAGESVQRGDEYLNDIGNIWEPVSASVGNVVSDADAGMVRRRVTPPSPAKEQP